jgi:hypothetical protein
LIPLLRFEAAKLKENRERAKRKNYRSGLTFISNNVSDSEKS